MTSSTTNTSTSTLHVTKDNIGNLNYYEIFHLDTNEPFIDAAELRRAYRRYTLLFHPDKDASSKAREAFEIVVLAVETLTNDDKRKEYDAELRKKLTSSSNNNNNNGSNSSNVTMRHNSETYADYLEREAKEREVKEEKAAAEAAESVLRQREMASRAEKEEAIRLASLKELAATRMREELTSALHTPFKVMEESLVREWGIDEELLSVKRTEICALLAELQSLNTHHNEKNAKCDINSANNHINTERNNASTHHRKSKRVRESSATPENVGSK